MDSLATKSRVEDKKLRKKKCNEIKRKYWLIVAGVVLIFCGYGSMLILQSSIRIEDGLASKVATTIYICQIVFSLFVAPFLMRIIGVKKALITSECGYILFVLANVYPHPVTIMIGAVCAGYAEAIFWIPLGISIVYYGKQYAVFSSKSEEACIMMFSGLLFGLFQINQIFGNALVSMILYIFESSYTIVDTLTNATSMPDQYNLTTSYSFNFTTPVAVFTTETPTYDSLMYCGANDCQDANVTQDSIDQYVPSNVAIYVLTATFLVVMLLGIIMHIFLVPEMPLELINGTKSKDEKEVETLKDANGDPESDVTVVNNENRLATTFKMSLESIKDVFICLLHPRQFFFTTPLSIYLGMNLGYSFFECTRAFASCVLGVSQIGVCMIVYATSAGIDCYIIGRMLGKFGHFPVIVFGFMIDLFLYIFCLLWQPTHHESGVVFLLFCILGISNGTWQVIVTTIYARPFYKNKEVSFSIFCTTIAIGYVIQFGISPLLCMREKIYILLPCLIVSASLSGFKEWQERGSNSVESDSRVTEMSRDTHEKYIRSEIALNAPSVDNGQNGIETKLIN